MKPKYITDRDLLKWIETGEIIITALDSRRPVLYFRGRQHTPTIVETHGKNHHGGSPRYRWELMNGYTRTGKRKRRTIVCAKLIWMFVNKRCVPFGHQVHHIDWDAFNDCAGNLTIKTDEQHYDEHYESIPA